MSEFNLNSTVIGSTVDFEGSDGADNVRLTNVKRGGIMPLSKAMPAMITLL